MDGFPRSLENWAQWCAHPFLKTVEVWRCLLLECDEALMVRRVLARGRADDGEAVALRRVRSYREDTGPIVEMFDRAGQVVRVDSGGAPEEVHALVRAVMFGCE